MRDHETSNVFLIPWGIMMDGAATHPWMLLAIGSRYDVGGKRYVTAPL